MKFFAAAALALSAALVRAQDISQIPQCALGCLATAIGPTGCQVTDFDCVCKQDVINKISGQVTQCVTSTCNDVQKDLQTLNAVNGICQMHGGTMIPNPLGGSSPSMTTSSSSIMPGPRASYFTAAAPSPAIATAAVGYALGAAGLMGMLAI